MLSESGLSTAAPFHPYSDILIKAAPELEPRKRTNKYAINGEPPSQIDLPQGCRFCPRCPFAKDWHMTFKSSYNIN